MKKATRGTTEQARLLTIDQASKYTGMGKSKCREWCEEIGAFRKIGTLARFDKVVIDAALDAMATQAAVS